MRLKVTKQGFRFPYEADEITYRWPWSRKGNTAFTSDLVTDFNDLPEYWRRRVQQENGVSRVGPVAGFSYREVFGEWVRKTFPGEYAIVVHQVNPESRVKDFWMKLPRGVATKLAGTEVSVLICKDRSQALEVTEAIPSDLAEAYLFKDGVLVDHNQWTEFE
jgi:hypothetical protein